LESQIELFSVNNMIPSAASPHPPCQLTLQAIANVERAMRTMRASRNFYPQQSKALLLTFHPITLCEIAPGGDTSPSPTPTEPAPLSATEVAPVLHTIKRRMCKSKELIDAIFSDSTQAGNLVKMLKRGSWD
jgi:hypothetical protein